MMTLIFNIPNTTNCNYLYLKLKIFKCNDIISVCNMYAKYKLTSYFNLYLHPNIVT